MQMEIADIFLRLLCAMVVGFVIGAGRERIHRPAGMRTHMVVAVGACVVMITGQLLFLQSGEYGAWSTPDRMAAQVISGIGFLGAGTIIREGLTIKGLTTAASLWSVACLGLAAGAGFYALTLGGTVAITITLSLIRPWQEKRFFQSSNTKMLLSIDCILVDEVLHRMEGMLRQAQGEMRHLEVESKEGMRFLIHASLHFENAATEGQLLSRWLHEFQAIDDTVKLHITIL
ncbi:MgtC/SapB family protein [Intestinibacillus sp. Marseille-P6563]|uniref:MgtC/SapB family protein n=1 Tax=Intestinibacillus sp. Marseille-P6563 TaxID=2364792 RepID=UPI000F055E2A|nr:MgtC/SapB family protein [Intestinibacillus sp. Marseille-P6563]